MKAKILLSLIVFGLINLSMGQPDDVRSKHFNISKNVAINGYDPVSYFKGKPKEGRVEFKLTYRGVTYLFENEGNRKEFKASPEKYEPVYGGWCAYAMGENGEKVKIDPQTYKILEGRLYLFYNFWGNNTLTDWNKNEAKLKESANRNWKNITQ